MESITFLERLPEHIKSTVQTIHLVEHGRNPSVVLYCESNKKLFVKCANSLHVKEEALILEELDKYSFKHLKLPHLHAQTSPSEDDHSSLIITSFCDGHPIEKSEFINHQDILLSQLVELHQLEIDQLTYKPNTYEQNNILNCPSLDDEINEFFTNQNSVIQAQFTNLKSRYEKACQHLQNKSHILALNHGDLSPDNILFDNKSLTLIDWEYASIIDIRWDLAALATENNLNTYQFTQLCMDYVALFNQTEKTDKHLHTSLTVFIQDAMYWQDVYKFTCLIWSIKHKHPTLNYLIQT